MPPFEATFKHGLLLRGGGFLAPRLLVAAFMPGAARRFFSRRSEAASTEALTASLRNAPDAGPGKEIDSK